MKQELGWRKALGGIAGIFRDLYSMGNIAFIHSELNCSEIYEGSESSAKNRVFLRPLLDQSPYVVNVSLGYENSVSWFVDSVCKTSIFVNYNLFSRRIIKLEVDSIPDTYEEPFHQLDLVFKQRFSEEFSIGVKAKNLLDLPAKETVGNKTVREFSKGRSIDLSISIDL